LIFFSEKIKVIIFTQRMRAKESFATIHLENLRIKSAVKERTLISTPSFQNTSIGILIGINQLFRSFLIYLDLKRVRSTSGIGTKERNATWNYDFS